MTLDDITIVGSVLSLSSHGEVDNAEGLLSIRFPNGYREYVTRLGDGVLGGCYIRIYTPGRILMDIAEYRQRIADYWFWDNGHAILTRQTALDTVIIGDTVDGDQLVIHPQHPERIVVLPRHSEELYVAGEGLLCAISWLCSSCILTEPFEEREFEPYADAMSVGWKGTLGAFHPAAISPYPWFTPTADTRRRSPSRRLAVHSFLGFH